MTRDEKIKAAIDKYRAALNQVETAQEYARQAFNDLEEALYPPLPAKEPGLWTDPKSVFLLRRNYTIRSLKLEQT